MKTFTLTSSDAAARREMKYVFDRAYDSDNTPARFCRRETLRGRGIRVHCPAWMQDHDVHPLAYILQRRAQLRAGTTRISVDFE